MISRNGSTRGSTSIFWRQLYTVIASAEWAPPWRQVLYTDHSMNRPTSSSPGSTPARNSRPIEVSVAMP